ncbi:MAG: ABC transporter permease [Clostridiales bacterium]|jgi:ribose transport system permease protein|nr:ABC transporter permease [Clostridiales bacterium]
MLIISIIFIALGAVSLIAGIASVIGQALPLLGPVSDTLSLSFVFFGVILIAVGCILLLMRKKEKVRQTIIKLVNVNEFTLIVVLLIFIYLFWAINHNYLSLGNVRAIFNSAFVMGTLAIGLSCLLISGKIDLSAGNTGMMAGIIIAILLKAGIPWVPALLITLAFGAVTGLINSFFVNKMGFAPFISTLAISTIYGGLSLVITNGANIPVNNKSFLELGSTNLWIFPLPFIIMTVLLIIYGIMLSATGFGRRIYMTGGNASASRLAGIKPKRITTILFVNNGVIACLAGAILASRMAMGSPSGVTGSDLDGITAAILGGVAFTGGAGNMFGVFIGILLITSFQNGLVVADLNSYYQVIAKGLLLLAALVLDFYRKRRNSGLRR